MATRRVQRLPLFVTGFLVTGLVVAVVATRSAGADEPTPLPELPPGTTLTATMLDAEPDGSLQDVRTSLTAALPISGHAFLVIDCIGPEGSGISVQHRDGRPWSPAAVVDGANHADGGCGPQGHRQAYGLTGAPSEVVTLDITGGPVTALRVVVSDTCPCQG